MQCVPKVPEKWSNYFFLNVKTQIIHDSSTESSKDYVKWPQSIKKHTKGTRDCHFPHIIPPCKNLVSILPTMQLPPTVLSVMLVACVVSSCSHKQGEGAAYKGLVNYKTPDFLKLIQVTSFETIYQTSHSRLWRHQKAVNNLSTCVVVLPKTKEKVCKLPHLSSKH